MAALTITATMLVAQGAWASNIFVKADNLTGESTVSGHAGEIEVESAQFSITNTLHGSPSGAGSASRPVFGEFLITKAVDKSSTTWFTDMAQGRMLGSVVVSFAKPGANGAVFYRVTLQNVYITEYQVDGSSGASTANATKETIGLSYQKVKVEYWGPGSATPASAGWDLSAGRVI